MKPSIGAALALSTLVAGCRRDPPPDLRALAAGAELCWSFERNEAAEALGLPWGVALGASAAEPVAPRPAVTLSPEGGRADFPINYWRWAAGDSVELGSQLMGPFQLVLVPSGDRLEGRGRTTGDVVRPGEGVQQREVSGVVARSVECPAG